MRVGILVDGLPPEGLVIDPARPNPGIGGANFTRLRLAQELAEAQPEWRVEVVATRTVQYVRRNANLRTTVVDRLTDYVEDVDRQSDWVIVGRSEEFSHLDPRLTRRVSRSAVLTSHLMYDHRLWDCERITRFAAIGCVGHYHFYATRTRSPKVYLRNLFLPGFDAAAKRAAFTPASGALRIAYVGALVPPKGFHDLAAVWPEVQRQLPGSTLDVIGSSDLWSRIAPSHPRLPTDRAYGDRLLALLGEDELTVGRVRFHGRMGIGKERIMGMADVGIVNVGNHMESITATAFEFLALGVPVAGSQAHGMWDAMHRFPELVTRRAVDLPAVLARYAADEDLQRILQDRVRQVALDVAAENRRTLARWDHVLRSVVDGRPIGLPSPLPVPPGRGTRWLRSTRRDLRYRARRVPGVERMRHFARHRTHDG